MNRKILAGLFIIALGSGFFWNQKIFNKPISSDQVIYDGVASDILSKGTFTYEGQETASEPAYPYFLAGIYKIFGHNFNAVRVIQIILFAFTVLLVFSLAQPLTGTLVALGAALLTSVFYPLANQAGLLLQETLFTFLVVSLVFALSKARHDRLQWYFGSGIILGLATLTKGSIEFFFIFVVGYMFWIYRKKIPLKQIFKRIGIFLIGFIIIVGPWLAREKFMGGNLGVAPRGGSTLLILTEVTEHLSQNYLGNFIGFFFGYYIAQKFYPDIDPVAFRDFSATQKRIADLTQKGTSLREMDGLFLKEAKDYIIYNPQKYAYMAVLNFINLNSPIVIKGPLWQNVTAIHPMFADGRHPGLPEIVKAGIALGVRLVWFVLFFLVGYCIWINWKNLDKFGWIILLVAYLNIFYSLVWTVPRYALPMYPLYFILAVVGFSHLWGRYSQLLQKTRK